MHLTCCLCTDILSHDVRHVEDLTVVLQELMKILYLDPDLNNLQDIAYNPGW